MIAPLSGVPARVTYTFCNYALRGDVVRHVRTLSCGRQEPSSRPLREVSVASVHLVPRV